MTQNRKSCRPKQGAELLDIGVTTFRRWARERPDFPPAKHLSARCIVFDYDELVAWRDAQGAKVEVTP